MKALIGGLLLLAAVAQAGDPDATCTSISPRELGTLVLEASAYAASQCPQAPACNCPAIPDRFVVCRTNAQGTVTKCLRRVLVSIPSYLP
jgi:hypothetical protein